MTGAGAAPLPDMRLRGSERIAVAVLGRLLPDGFRDRQRAEWTGDLIALAGSGTGQRWRYLFWAAWTLPSLRAAARRAGLRAGDRPAGAVASSGFTTAVARVLLIGVGWPVLSWLVMIPGRYYLYDVPGRIARQGGGTVDPKDLWPDGWLYVVLVPLIALLTWGSYVALWGTELMVATLCLAAVAVAVTLRGASARLRVSLAIGGTAVLAPALAILSAGLLGTGPDGGNTATLLGLVALGMAVAAESLTRRMRIALALVGLGALVMYRLQFSDAAQAMQIWFLD